MESLVQLIVPQPCYSTYFIDVDFFHLECFKIVISKCLGYGIISGSLLVKVPQILKIQRAGTAEGLSIISTSLELIALTGSLCYSVAKSFPFSTYGEAAFLILQTALIAFLVLMYNRNGQYGAMYLAVYSVILAVLLSPLAPISLLWTMQAAVMPLVVTARMLQALTNYRNHSTGQLSLITVLMLFLGSLARIFTSLQETGDTMIILTFIVSSFCNAVLLAQLAYYWKSPLLKEGANKAHNA